MQLPGRSARRWAVVGAVAAMLLTAAAGFAQQGDGTDVAVVANTWKPAKVPADEARIGSLRVAPGFAVNVFARGLGNTRIIAVAPNGDVYVTRREEGDILLLRDADRDGRADAPLKWVGHRAGAHGIAIRGKQFYLVTVKELFVTDIQPDGMLGTFRPVESLTFR